MAQNINIDLSGIADPNQPAPEDDYTLEIIEALVDVSQTAGEQMVKINTRIIGGGGDDIEDHVGKFVRDSCMMEGKGARLGLWRLSEYMRIAGATEKQMKNPDVDMIQGLEFEAHVTVQPPRPEFDRETNRIQRLLD